MLDDSGLTEIFVRKKTLPPHILPGNCHILRAFVKVTHVNYLWNFNFVCLTQCCKGNNAKKGIQRKKTSTTP